MEKANKLTYDEALQRAESIITQLEQAEALSMDDYKRMANEATAMLQYCKSLLTEMDEDVTIGIENL
jgi:exodeoxyribonuclease VII small subunit